MAGEQSLGRAKVEITAETTQFNAAVDQAKAKLNELGTEGKINADNLWNGMVQGADRAAASTENAAKAAAGFSFGLSNLATAGVVAGIAAVGFAIDKIKDKMEEARKKQEELKKAIVDSADIYEKAQDAINDVLMPPSDMDREIRSATRPIEKAMEELEKRRDLFGDQKNKSKYDALQKQIDDLERQKKEVEKTIADRYSERGERAFIEKKKADQIKADDETYANFAKNAEKEQQDEERANKEAERAALRLQEIEARTAQIRLRGIIDATNALEQMYATQQRGFGASDSGGSLAAQISNLTEEMRRISLRSNGAVN